MARLLASPHIALDAPKPGALARVARQKACKALQQRGVTLGPSLGRYRQMTGYQHRLFALRDLCGHYYKARTIREHLYHRLVVRPFTAILAAF